MYYSIKEVASILDIKDTTIISWIRTYKLYYIRYSVSAGQKHYMLSGDEISTIRKIKKKYYKTNRGRKPKKHNKSQLAQHAESLQK